MGARAHQLRRQTNRTLRTTPLTADERERLRNAQYEGSPLHKRNPGDFGLTPPAAPRPTKTLCDEAEITSRADAEELFQRGIKRELVSEAQTLQGYPKQFWVVDKQGNVFEAMSGGSRPECYHGYPIRRSDPLFRMVTRAWNER